MLPRPPAFRAGPLPEDRRHPAAQCPLCLRPPHPRRHRGGHGAPEIDPDFAVEFWLQAIRGLTHPTVLDRTQLTPRQTLEKAIKLFFGGLLTAAGRKL
jgi:hypothetical protein